MKAYERLLLSLGSEKFTDEFKKILLELNISLKEFSDHSEIPYSTLYKVMNKKDFRVSTLQKIIKVIKEFEKDDELGDRIAIIAARSSLNKLTQKTIEFDNKTYAIKEYPSNTLEECLISAVSAERDGVKAIVCAPIVSACVEKLVRIPVAVVITESTDYLKAVEIAASKI
ncbi:helix-turn-helix domain-containing protein [Methanococcus voltae]|uniref:Transcriptional regulator protein with an HTH domain-like protein n=1 Tax=Methanococcus voltae (strain ATCC BAA-1334 / A3) TaxID=456320 RepID=D7DUD0_METV3|nr:helix-turn-helix domain-containing protein [Methanococcus voltae]MCS3900540.1 putative transcriptional regulator [Methanococcus voltae]